MGTLYGTDTHFHYLEEVGYRKKQKILEGDTKDDSQA